jgi:hypothetical protein
MWILSLNQSRLISSPLLVPIIGRFGRVIITAKGGDDNLLSTAVWKELRMLDDIIQNTTTEFDGDVFSYRQICARWEDECFTNDILNLDYILPEVIAHTNISISGQQLLSFSHSAGREWQPVALLAHHA